MNDDEFKMKLDNAFRDDDQDVLNEMLGWDKNYDDEELLWDISYSNHHEIFNKHMSSINDLLNADINNTSEFSLLVMLYGHIVASIEAYLSSKFINKVTNSDKFIRRLIETDPVFSKMKISLKDIYTENENLKIRVATYLKDLIFHKIPLVKSMYKSVLGYNLNDVEWLIKAVALRHDCVHRAGFTKENEKITINSQMVRDLMDAANHLVTDIEMELYTVEIE